MCVQTGYSWDSLELNCAACAIICNRMNRRVQHLKIELGSNIFLSR